MNIYMTKDWLDLPLPKLHEVRIICRECKNIFDDSVYMTGDWSKCPKCFTIHSHTYCNQCHSFYTDDWKSKVENR